MKVLIADDSGIIRTIIARVLSTLGEKKPIEAANGAAAWQEFQKQAFKLVIVDWHMPCIDGLELAKLIRLKQPDIPILMVTVVDTRAKIVEALEAGVTDFLCKPFEREQLATKLEKYLQT